MSAYMVTAAIELLMLSALSGVVGTWAVLRKRAFFAVALSHATFPGGVIAAMLGVNVLLGQGVAAFVLVPIMALISRVKHQGGQVASGVVLSFGFALGALLASVQNGMRVPVDALLVGQVFGVDLTDVWAAGIALLVCGVAVLVMRRRLLFDTFDSAGARAAGFSPAITDAVVVSIIAITVVVSMPAVGAILSVAIVIGPAATARLLVSRVERIVPTAFFIAVVSSAIGLWVSWQWKVAAGGAIGITVGVLFVLAFAANRLRVTLHERRAVVAA
jgi:zinc/manganese transport system permease protein